MKSQIQVLFTCLFFIVFTSCNIAPLSKLQATESSLELSVNPNDDYSFFGQLLGRLLIQDFELVDHNGSNYKLSEDDTEIIIFIFGYANCPDICPLTLNHLRNVKRNLAPADQKNVKLLFISIDPERDTPEILQRYVNSFGGGVVGLRGAKEEIDPILEAYWGEYTIQNLEGTSQPYLIDHTSTVYLLGPNKEFMLQYEQSADYIQGIATDIEYLLGQSTP